MTNETQTAAPDEAKPAPTTLQKITGVLEDAIDIIGLGQRVVSTVRDLATNPEHGKQLRKETKKRAKQIRKARKGE